HPLVPGEHLVAADLTTGRARFAGAADRYVAGSSVPSGYVVTRYVGAGELVPAGALSAAPSTEAATRLVTLSVPVGHAPLDLARGETVDVYVTPKRADSGSAAPALVLPSAPVDSASGGDALGASDQQSVVVVVPVAQVAAVIAATEGGAVDLVLVP